MYFLGSVGLSILCNCLPVYLFITVELRPLHLISSPLPSQALHYTYPDMCARVGSLSDLIPMLILMLILMLMLMFMLATPFTTRPETINAYDASKPLPLFFILLRSLQPQYPPFQLNSDQLDSSRLKPIHHFIHFFLATKISGKLPFSLRSTVAAKIPAPIILPSIHASRITRLPPFPAPNS